MNILEPGPTAAIYRDQLREEVAGNGLKITIVGFIASNDAASKAYANYTKEGCDDVGIEYRLIEVAPEDVHARIEAANADKNIHGIFVYYPIFGDARDDEIKEAIAPTKDVEGLTSYWMQKLYANERFDDDAKTRKCILPCTPLAIIKMLEQTPARAAYGLPFAGQTITVFNRSEVVGRPLAYMLANDGARVYSFDVTGGIVIGEDKAIARAEALRQSDIVITGVPRHFDKIKADELKPDSIGLNFSYAQNFEEEAKQALGLYIPRVGTVTVAICLRNALRLYQGYQHA